DFWVPDDVIDMYRAAGARGGAERTAWEERKRAWSLANPGPAEEFDACVESRALAGWEQKLPTFEAGTDLATRAASQKVLTAIADVVPGLMFGSGDLTGNTGMLIEPVGIISADDMRGRVIHYGIREHGMGAAANGMAATGLLPSVGTFFVFSDYMRPAVRIASIMQAKVAFVWSHDSIGVGEDGPTHQPIEQLASLRAMPGL